ncbi:MAG TPA: glycosyltransferase family 39 protein [Nitrospirota bacterium]|nr:glycosyltransferase family 39 protein [Nitrospirota bacterium]
MNPFPRLYDQNREALWIIAAFTLLRLAVAPTFGLGTDEAHYVLYARFLDWSYFDHPPLVGWTHALFYYTLGTNEFLARLPAILLIILTSLLCYRFVLSVSAKRPALLALVALNSSFLLSGLGLMLLPESLLLPITFALIFTVLRLGHSPGMKNFILLGLVLGLAGLAKYTSILFVPAILIYALIRKRYDILLNPRILISTFVALVVISPVIYWNIHTDFISFRYQSGHVVGGHIPNFIKFFQGLGAQFGAYSPPLFCLAFYGLYKAFRSRQDALILAALIGASILLFFLYSSLFKFALPHWSAVFYALFIPLGIAFLDQSSIRMKQGILVFSLGFSILIALLLQSELAFKAFRFPDYTSPFRDVYGMPDIVMRANKILALDASPRKALAVTNWTYVSRTMYYNIPYKSAVFLLGNDDERFTTWYSGSPFGEDILFITNHFERPDIGREMKCRQVSDAGQMDILLHGGKVDTIDYVWCRSFSGINTRR